MNSPAPVIGPVFLAGMMGSGKSTIGQLLAGRLGWVFIDLDRRIERLAGRSVAALFAERGEPGFRELELMALRTLLDEPGMRAGRVVVSLGGGTPAQTATATLLRGAGVTVYLRVGRAELVRRLSRPADRAARPLLADADLDGRIGRLLSDRGSSYEGLDFTVDAENAPHAVVERILEILPTTGASADGS